MTHIFFFFKYIRWNFVIFSAGIHASQIQEVISFNNVTEAFETCLHSKSRHR
jgi:hypothetical protein